MPRTNTSEKEGHIVRNRKPAPEATKMAICPIVGCNAKFVYNTDVSRHKWDHIPREMLPSCPLGDGTCAYKYKGRASSMRNHMRAHHRGSVPLPPHYRWPTLVEIMNCHGIIFVEKDMNTELPTIVAPSKLSPLPAPSAAPSATLATGSGSGSLFDFNFDGFERMQQYIQSPVIQDNSLPHTNAPEETPIQLVPQGYFWPPPSSSSFTIPKSSSTSRNLLLPEYFTPSAYSVPYSSVDGPHPPAEGLYVPQEAAQPQSLDHFPEDLDFSQLFDVPKEAELSFDEWAASVFPNAMESCF